MTNRYFLKTSSQAAHRMAESAWLGQGYFNGQSGYLAWLQALQLAHGYIGMAASATISPVEGCAEERTRLRALASDLHSPGLPVPKIRCCPDHSWAWGACYALNGSALGAVALLRRGMISDTWPASYVEHMAVYAKSGALAGFLKALDSQVLDREAAGKGTHAVFAALSEPDRFRRMLE
ncbi:hypothetical protein [uncultured Roseobacter sp.]|uniref:hypothetical protein n=1 Tax=uncultured Roseobacter sp. TaxID=114847 RepID=UPI002605DBCB|nr:hypothetical protein [uncultured Roseobacter sp.]